MKNTKKVAYCGVICALSVIFLLLGSMVSIADLSTAALCSLFMIFVCAEFGNKEAVTVFIATSFLSFLLLPEKTPAFMYVFFAGWYPILKRVVETKFSRKISWILKVVSFNASVTLFLLFSREVLMLPETKLIYILIYILGNITFVLYDIVLSRFVKIYFFKIRGLLASAGLIDK